jgi:hypothetical protein
MDSENATGAHKTQRMAAAVTYHEDGNEFLNHIVRVTDDETWISYVAVQTKEQPKKWMHTHSTKR